MCIAFASSFPHLGVLRGAQREEDGKVPGKVPPEGLSEGQEEVGARPNGPGVPGAPGHPAERRRRRLEVAILPDGQGVRRGCREVEEVASTR